MRSQTRILIPLCASALMICQEGFTQSVRYALLDFGGTGGRVEPGAVGGQIGGGADGTNATNMAPVTVSAETGDEFTVAIDNVDADGFSNGNVDWRDRGDHANPEPLVQLGEDLVKNNAGTLRVTLEGLPAGVYQATSYHYDGCCDQAKPVSVLVNDDGTGFADTGAAGDGSLGGGGVDPLTTALMEQTKAEFGFTSDGINPVIIIFDATTAADTEVPLNGMEISVSDPNAQIFRFSANSPSILPGQTTDLAWEVAPDATSIILTQDPGGDIGDVSDDTDANGAGSRQVSPAVTTTYVLEVESPAGAGSAQAVVEVALIAFFESDMTLLEPGESATLSWRIREDATAVITPDPGPIETIDGIGSVSVSPGESTTYVLTVSAPGADDASTEVDLVVSAGGGGSFAEPEGGWDLVYDGDLDPTTLGWDHNNGSDQWDGSEIGEGRPGGAGIYSEGGVTFLRLQDPGDPGNDPSNRKVFFTRDLTDIFSAGYSPLTDGVTLNFRTRVATPSGGPLDNYDPGGGAWPASGDGYSVHDGGKSVFGIRDATYGGIVSFAPSTEHVGSGSDYSLGDGLAMNRLVGSSASNEVDGDDVSGEANLLSLVPQEWQEIWVTIEAESSGGGTHRADIYLNGSTTPDSFHLTAGAGSDQSYTYAVIGLGATPQTGAIDVDFFNVKEGIHIPTSSQRLVVDFARDPETGNLRISWASAGGKLYNLRSESDLSSGEPALWPIYAGNADLEATPPENTLVLPFPSEPERYFVIEEFPAPPESVFEDDFESGQGAWTTGSDGLAGTVWELGAPSGVGPSAANSPTNVFATNIDGEYEFDADVWLRSPAIDLTPAGGATLHYAQFIDIEPTFDAGAVRVLDATDDSEIAIVVPVVEGLSTDWESQSKTLPAEALGKTIKIEFRFTSDDFSNFAGWYLDDVLVTVP